ncbi:MAG: NAD(P)-dependent oxidoreductase, partial [Proteobacteria bacterium]|nr:NAD(P)-dependent oxidoreductase [Pseudomonadota bacterium]
MTENRIAILMPGDMGHAVGRALRQHGHAVTTCLAGRSARTRGLAAAAGMRDAGSLEALVAEADLILSILPPDAAVAQAGAVARAMTATGAKPVYVDCNAVSPQTARKIGAVIAAAGAPFIDCGIIGAAPGKGKPPRFHVSGPDTGAMERLDGKGIRVVAMGPEIGRASALKMVYAGLTKGTMTLHTAMLLAAWQLGIYDEAVAEYADSQPAALAAMRDRVPRIPADAGRWIGEMEEIAATLAEVGIPSAFHDGAAAICRVLERTPFAAETRETLDR